MAESEGTKLKKSIAAKRRWETLRHDTEFLERRREGLRTHWSKLSAEERSAIGKRAAETRKRNGGSGLYKIITPTFTGGILVENGIIRKSAKELSWMRGRRVQEIRTWCKRVGYQMKEVKK